MSLLAPLGLAALLAIPLIILFHMRHTTPPRRPVSSLRFWEAARPLPAEERRLRRPPLTLPLILQLLAVALLALALARPATAGQLASLAPGLRTEPRHLILLLDGSTSMGAISDVQGQSRWDAARQAALDRLAPLREGDVATVILMGTRPQTFTATDSASLISLRQRLAGMVHPGGRANLDTALSLAGDLFLPNLERQVVVIGDGAATADPAVVAGVGAPVELVVAGGDGTPAQRANLAITEIAARPNPGDNGTIGLYVSVANFGPEAVRVPVSLSDGTLEIGRGEVTIAGDGTSESLRWMLPPGITELTARIGQSDALEADNSASILLDDATGASIAPRVLLLTDLPGAVARALTAIDNVQVVIEPSGNLAAIAAGDYDLIVFDRAAPPVEMLEAIETPSLWVAPPVGGPFATTEQIADPRVTRVRAGDPLLAGVDLAGAPFGPTATFVLAPGDEEVAGSPDGPILFRTLINDHPAVVMTVDPEASNLPKRVAFPVLIANLAAELAPDGIPAALPLGDPLVYEPRASTAEVEIVPPSGEATLLSIASASPGGAASRDVVFTNTGMAGVYQVAETAATAATLGTARFVVNAGHARESDLRINEGLGATLATASGGGVNAPLIERVELWPLLALAALAVILLEWIAALWPRRGLAARPVAAGGRR